MTALPPADQAARTRIREDHGRTLFVQAGAGTGKTTALVSRVVEMVAVGALADIAHLAAITFTENAAAELRTRLRSALDEAARGHHRDRSYDAAQQARAAAALSRFDEAAVTTLHGFAYRLLAEAPLEAGLPPGFEVRDAMTAQLEQQERWRQLVDDLLADADLASHVRAGLTLGLSLTDLQEVEAAFTASWDLLTDRPLRRVPLPEPGADLVASLEAATADSDAWPTGDRLSDHLRNVVVPTLDGLRTLEDPDDVLALLDDVTLSSGNGLRAAWRRAGLDKSVVVAHLKDAERDRGAFLERTGHAVTTTLAARVQDHVLTEADRRRDIGRLDFHDLLVRARDLLRDDPQTRAALALRWPVLMVDEFQDTDPLQVQIVELLAADRPVFYVGDPRQSIYRFRRADVELYASVGRQHAAGRTELSVSFRSVPGIIDVTNHVFRSLLGDDPTPYADLEVRREAMTGDPSVTVLGAAGEPGDTADVLRHREATHLVDALRRIRHEAWVADGTGGRRRPSFADMAILMPTRVSLPAIEEALQERDIPYRVESRSLVWSTDAVRDLLTLLQAIANPADAVATVAALRHPGLACPDPDLAAWTAAGGSWHAFAPTPPGCQGTPVDAGMATLRRLHDLRWWLPVPELVALAVRELRLVELTAGLRRPRDHWRRLRFVVDQARAFADAGGSGLGTFVTWAVGQQEAEADLLETAVPEPDDDAVRVLTVHGAKGLEFPVTAVAGLGSPGGGQRRVVWCPDGPQVRLRARRLETDGWKRAAVRDTELDTAERLRVLYVAMTRARDHLLLGCYHKAPPTNAAPTTAACHAQRLIELLGAPHDLARHEPTMPAAGAVSPATATPDWSETDSAAAAAAADRFDARRPALLQAIGSRVATSPTALAAETTGGAGPDRAAGTAAPRSGDVVRPSSSADRGPDTGARLGTAVHRVLELVALHDTDEAVRRLAAAACHETGIPWLVDDVVGRVRTVLDDPDVRAALAGPRAWREVYLIAPDGLSHRDGVGETGQEQTTAGDARMIEGYVDLLVEDPIPVAAAQDARPRGGSPGASAAASPVGPTAASAAGSPDTAGPGRGLMVLDYKTDRAATPQERAERARHYRPQLEAYRRMVEQVTGRPVRSRLVFAAPGPTRPAAP